MSLAATHANGSGPVPAGAATASNCFNMKQLQNLVKDEVMNYYAANQQFPNNKLAVLNNRNAALPPVGPTAAGKAFSRNASFTSIDLEKNEKRVLVIYSGGTIGMSRGPGGSLVPIPHMLEKTVRRFPHMHDEDYARQRFGDDAENAPLCLP